MTVTCVVQARTGSTRLPGKVLAELCGRPMLAFLLERLVSLHVDHLVVATSDLVQDDPVADAARRRGVDVVRGSESDVLDRFLRALDAYPADVVVRLTADCPLSDPAIIEAAIDLRAATGADYASNSLLRTFPVGLDVEVVSTDALREAAAEATDAAEREHVMPFIYRRPERYRLAALRTPALAATQRWTVDTPADLERVRSIVARLRNPLSADWLEMLAVAPAPAARGETSAELVPATTEDAGRILAISSDVDAVRLGAADPVLPSSDQVHGGTRTWLVRRDDEVLGWVQVDVKGGVGRLGGRARKGNADVVRACLREAMRTDFQVREWDEEPWVTGEQARPAS